MMKWPILSFLCVIAVSAHALKCEYTFYAQPSFQEAKAFIRSQGIQTRTAFQAWKRAGKKPKNFPGAPQKTYKDEWTNWGDFLGTRNRSSNKKKEWMSFQDAKTFIQSQGIQTSTEFHAWSKSGKRPKNFPSNPKQTYKDEWTNWYDFLGTENISNNKTENTSSNKKEWITFQEAKDFIQSQGITNQSEFHAWKKAGKRPKNFPSNPYKVYKDEWVSWNDFLGTENISNNKIDSPVQARGTLSYDHIENTSSNKKEWITFQDAKDFIQSEGLQTSTEFIAWSKSSKRPKNFPSNPKQVYKDEWTNWQDFLGAKSNKEKWITFQEAKIFIQSQGITNQSEFNAWKKAGKRPKNFPSTPYTVYKDKWISWGDFLGTGNISNNKKKWMSFQDAKDFIQQQGIVSVSEFIVWSRSGQRPKNFPSNPQRTYSQEWKNWGDFLGAKEKWMSFQDAKTFIQSQGIQTSTEFHAWSKAGKRPKNFPSAPWQTYIDEWTNWNDFLGTKSNKEKWSTFQDEWMSFQDAKTFIQQQGIISVSEFEVWSKSEQRPQNFPPNPIGVYANKWNGWSDFLGTENTDYMKDRTDNKHTEIQEYMSYIEAKIFVQQLRIKTPIDFFETQRNEPDIFPENFPPKPRVFYTNTGEWIDWNDFLGLEIKPRKKKNKKSSKQAQGFIDWLKSQENTDENIEIEDDQNVEGNLTNDFTDEELDAEKDFTDDFSNEESDAERDFTDNLSNEEPNAEGGFTDDLSDEESEIYFSTND